MDYYAVEEAKRAARKAARQEIAALKQAEIEARKTPEERQTESEIKAITLVSLGLVFFSWKVTYEYHSLMIFLIVLAACYFLLFFSYFTRLLLSFLAIAGCGYEIYRSFIVETKLGLIIFIAFGLFIVFQFLVVAGSKRLLYFVPKQHKRQREFDEYGFEVFRGD